MKDNTQILMHLAALYTKIVHYHVQVSPSHFALSSTVEKMSDIVNNSQICTARFCPEWYVDTPVFT